jgi:hypothetical protein
MTGIDGREVNAHLLYEYSGVVHVHTIWSDGSGDLTDIVEAAREAEVGFVVVTDHSTLALKRRGDEGWFEGVLVLVGEEVTNSEEHCLSLDIERCIPAHLATHDIIEEIARQNGLSFIVHPHGRYRLLVKVRDLSWTAWSSETFTGMEIWSYMFDWVSRVHYLTMPYYLAFPDRAVRGPFPETLAKWDELNRDRRVVGIGGVDAHAKTIGPLVTMSYASLFRTVRTHVLMERPLEGSLSSDSAAIYGALAGGRCFIAYERHALATGFRFAALSAGEWAHMGDRIESAGGVQFVSTTPSRASLRLLRDGKLVREVDGEELVHQTSDPGVYRVEVFLNGRPWIYSNPITLLAAP